MKIKKYLSNFKDLKGKTILITGADGGIGSEIAKHFAFVGCNLIFANRSETKSKQLRRKILAIYPDVKINSILLDLCSSVSVKQFLAEVKNFKIDFFIHIAGIYNVKRFTTDLGFDNIYQTNCLMPYFITKKLLPYFEKNHTKVIYMGSIAYNYSKINPQDIEFKNCKKINKVYGNSKRVAMFAFDELFKNSKAEFSIAHPGLTLTKMTNHYPKAINWLVKIGLKIVCPPPSKAGLSVIYATTNKTKTGVWIGPRVFNIWGKPKEKRFQYSPKEMSLAHKIVEEQILNINI